MSGHLSKESPSGLLPLSPTSFPPRGCFTLQSRQSPQPQIRAREPLIKGWV